MKSVSLNCCLPIISADLIVLCIFARQVSNLLLLALKLREEDSA